MTSPKRPRTVTKWPENTSAAAAIAGNDDLLVEILIRLPAKSVLRFRSVSKRWLSLISDPLFSLIWSKPKSVSGLLLRRLSHSGIPKLEYIPFDNRNQSSVPFTSLDFVDDDPEGIDILQSCNGLLLCSSFRLRHHSCNYYVYNPTTNQFTALPRPVGFEKRIVRGVNLAFDYSKSHHYKVICVCSHSVLLRGIYWIEIYSSETQNWRPYDDIVLGPSDMVFDKALFWNGSIHWLSRQSETSLCFDTDQECLKTIPMPPIEEGENERTSCYFGESGGHLHLAVLSGSHSALLNVFEMEPDYSKWFVKYRVDLDSVVASFPEMEINFPVSWDYCKFSVLCVLHGETENESSLVIYIPGKVIYYNLKDNYIIKCFDVMNQTDNGDISLHCKWVIGHQYIESLIYV